MKIVFRQQNNAPFKAWITRLGGGIAMSFGPSVTLTRVLRFLSFNALGRFTAGGAIFFFSLFFSPVAFAQSAPRYTIDATLDIAAKKITAQQTLVWTNPSTQTVHDLVFHIYPNRRYKIEEKDLLRRFAGYFKVSPFPEGFQTGRMQILSVQSRGQKLKFYIEGEDQTILKVELPESVKPKETLEVVLEFCVDIPHITLGRFGWHDQIFRVSRWYPILSVLDDTQGWNKNPDYPFHRPFFSEASLYTVALTIAQNQIVAHTGKQSATRHNPDGTKTEIYQTPDPVREFSFAASSEYQVLTKDLGGVTIYSYYLPRGQNSARAAIASAGDLIRFYTAQFGKLPYDHFSIAPVDLGYGGEQMSNLIFIDRRSYQMPGMMNRYFDFLVAHETGHQWFFNLVGADEYQQMWLEEGFNSYFIERYLAQKYGENAEVIDFPPWLKKIDEIFLPRLTFKNTRDTRYKSIARIGMDHMIISELSSFSEPSAIFSVTYGKGARVLGMLKSCIGDEAFSKVFQRIFEQYRYKNLSVSDFIRICQQEHGKSLAWFFDAWLYSDKQYNYGVSAQGKNLVLKNRGAILMPTQITVEKKDGTQENLTTSLSKVQTLAWPRKDVKRIEVDPKGQWLDIDRTDNQWPRKVHVKFVPLYLGLYEIPTVLPDDGYSLIAGPELANNGLGFKASLQKPYDQIFYAASDYEFGEQQQRSRAGYELKNVLNTQTVLGFEVSNTTDYKDGADDLVSGKVFLRRELWPAQYNIADINDHVSFYLVRNQSINDGADLLSGREAIRNTDYGRRREAIVGSSAHFDRSGTSPDPSQGYKIDFFVENAGHFLQATQSFSRAAVETSFYWPLTFESKAAVRLKYGAGYPDDKVLFYAGGIDGLRGYERKTLRGANMLLGSLEYRFPLFKQLKISACDHILGLEDISGVVFFDGAEAWFSSVDSSPWRKDAGIGLRLMFNIGSLFEKVLVRLDVAQAINDAAEDHPRFWAAVNHAF